MALSISKCLSFRQGGREIPEFIFSVLTFCQNLLSEEILFALLPNFFG